MITPANIHASTRPKAGPRARAYAMMFCSVVYLLTQAACQKQNIKVKGHDLGTILAADKPRGVPIEIPGALEALRSVFQTRGVVSLGINLDQISNSSSLELINNTTKTSLIKAPAGAFSLSTSGDEEGAEAAWSLADNGYEFRLTIYPMDPHFVGKFAYGVNDLVLNVDEQKIQKDAKQSLTMQDFTYFYHPHAFFPTNDQKVDGFEGELLTITGPYIGNSDKSYEISTSPIGILNR
ncbi:MAG: hypothetical protein NTZ90_09625 [Proteobacteria bacterium]|nr:hypothetical protein [Pseudomonadota bacterium]